MRDLYRRIPLWCVVLSRHPRMIWCWLKNLLSKETSSRLGKLIIKRHCRGIFIYFAIERVRILFRMGLFMNLNFQKNCPRSSPSLEKQSTFSSQAICWTDASNVYTAAISLQPRTVDKLTKIALGFIRGLSAAVHFSFLDPHHNPSDLGTKMSGGRAISLKHSMGRRFDISFAGRRELKRLENSPKWFRCELCPGDVLLFTVIFSCNWFDY